MSKLFEKFNKLSLPLTIIIASIILGGFIFASQISKQRSIERQQFQEQFKQKQEQEANFELEQMKEREKAEREAEAQRAKADLEYLKLKQDECKALSAGVIKKWGNVMGVTYDNDFWKECVVTYTDPKTGEIKTSPLRFMGDSK